MAEKTAAAKSGPKDDQKKDPAKIPAEVSAGKAEETAKPAEPAPVSPAPKGFFAEFESSAKGKEYRYLLFLFFGLLTAGILYLLKPTIESFINPTPSLEESYNPVSTEPKSMHLEISNPDDEILTFDKTINISGKTSPKSSVVISSGNLYWGIDADTAGGFSKVIDLTTGINQISIYAFDPQGNTKTESRTIYLSEEKI